MKQLERQRRQILNDYKTGVRKAGEVVLNINAIDAEIKRLKET